MCPIFASQGTSVVLYRSAELRRHQYTAVTDWSGGLYISPGIAGSRPGALIATAWAAMQHLGFEGYRAAAERILGAADAFRAGVAAIAQLRVLGEPEASVVAFEAAPGQVPIPLLGHPGAQRVLLL